MKDELNKNWLVRYYTYHNPEDTETEIINDCPSKEMAIAAVRMKDRDYRDYIECYEVD